MHTLGSVLLTSRGSEVRLKRGGRGAVVDVGPHGGLVVSTRKRVYQAVDPRTDVAEFNVQSSDGRARTHYPIGTWKMPGASGAGAIAPSRGDAVSGTGVPKGE